MYIRGLHTDFEVHSIKNQKITAIFSAAIFLINLKIFLQRVLKMAVTRSILVQLRSGFLQTSYFIYENVILKKMAKKSPYFSRGARGYPQVNNLSIFFKNIKYIYS